VLLTVNNWMILLSLISIQHWIATDGRPSVYGIFVAID